MMERRIRSVWSHNVDRILSHLERLAKSAFSEVDNTLLEGMLGVSSLAELSWMIYSAPFRDHGLQP